MLKKPLQNTKKQLNKTRWRPLKLQNPCFCLLIFIFLFFHGTAARILFIWVAFIRLHYSFTQFKQLSIQIKKKLIFYRLFILAKGMG